jgi:cytochrome P450
MTALFLPAIADQPKPEATRNAHPAVPLSALVEVPGRRGLPYFGILPEAVFDPLRFSRRMLNRYGPVHRFRACGSWNVQLVGAEANEFVLFDAAGNFSSEGGWRPVFGKHFDGGLLLRDGQDHRWHRKLVATAFKQEQLQAYLDIFVRNIDAAVRRWSGRSVALYEAAQQLTFSIGFEAFLGRDAALATREDLLAFRYLMQSATSVVATPLPGNSEWRARWAERHVEQLIRPMFDEPVADDRSDLLAVLLRMRQGGLLDEGEILAHLTFVIAASFDTLSSAIASTLYHLAEAPEWQAGVRAELCDRIPDRGRLTLADLQRSELAEWAIKEALRLNAAAPVLWRRSVRPFSFAGYSFPAGTITGVNPMLTHLLSDLWPDPERFDPLRFSPERSRGRHRFAYVPFGGGAHGCIGANYALFQVKALLRLLLEEHRVLRHGSKAPAWYHWPNCRPQRRFMLAFEPLVSR